MPPAARAVERDASAARGERHHDQSANADDSEPERAPAGDFEVQQVSLQRGDAQAEAERVAHALRVAGQVFQHGSEPAAVSVSALHVASCEPPKGQELPIGGNVATEHKREVGARIQRQRPAHQQDTRTASEANKRQHGSCAKEKMRETEARR